MSDLKIIEIGNTILRKTTKKLTEQQISSVKIQHLIDDMKHLSKSGKYGVGLAAPQVGKNLALSVITIRPTPSHPERDTFETVIINPEIIEEIGEKVDKWEGCMSFGVKEPMFAQTKRYETIKVQYLDQKAKLHKKTFTGLIAHVFQHEIDHLNGILFVDRIVNSHSWMSSHEYKKMLAKNKKQIQSDTIHSGNSKK